MHPPVHRLLGWASRPSALASRRCIWRLDQLRGFTEAEALVQGDPAETDAATLERLPTLLGAVLLSGSGEPLGRLVDAAVELSSGRIRHYLVARSDPRLPGGSRWRLSPERIVDQRPGEVSTALQGLADLPLAHASLRETLLRRSRLWRDQWDEESSRLRDQWQQASGRFEQRLEGWLEEPPWDPSAPERPERPLPDDIWPAEPWPADAPPERRPERWDPRADERLSEDRSVEGADEPWQEPSDSSAASPPPPRPSARRSSRSFRPRQWRAGDRPVDPLAADRDHPDEWTDTDTDDLPDDDRDGLDGGWADQRSFRSDPTTPRRGRPLSPSEQQDDPWV